MIRVRAVILTTAVMEEGEQLDYLLVCTSMLSQAVSILADSCPVTNSMHAPEIKRKSAFRRLKDLSYVSLIRASNGHNLLPWITERRQSAIDVGWTG